MVILHNLGIFERIYKTARFLKVLDFTWNPVTKQMEPGKDPSYTKAVSRKCHLHFFFVLGLTLQAIFVPEHLPYATSVTEKLVGMSNLMFNLFAHIFLEVLTRKSGDAIRFMNGTLKAASATPTFLVRRESVKLSLVERVNILFVYVNWITVIFSGVLIVFGFHWMEPCKPSLVGYWLLPQCQTGTSSILETVLKFILFCWNCWMVYVAASIGAFLFGNVCILSTFTLRDLLKR